MESAARESSVVQVDTQAIIDDRLPMRSVIPLAQVAGADRQSGLLTPSQIVDMTLNSVAVMLPKSERPEYGLRDGEGVQALAWSLFVAGARQTIVSQWNTTEAATGEMTSAIDMDLLRRSESGKRVASASEAIRQAALKMISGKEYKDPCYWAGFLVVGGAVGLGSP
jgi:CHAT domain-containing protein